MTSVQITFDVEPLLKELRDTGRRQAPFALANAINATVNDMQRGIQNAVTQGRGFVIRSDNSRRFLRNQIHRTRGEDFATKTRPVGRVRIQNKGRTSLLSLIDQGGQRSSRFALSPDSPGISAVPVPVRDTPGATIAKSLYPAKLGLQKRGKGLKGSRRTFVVTTKAGDTLLLQRRSKKTVRTLFVVKPKVAVRAKQFFAPTAERIALDRFDGNFDQAMRNALRTAR